MNEQPPDPRPTSTPPDGSHDLHHPDRPDVSETQALAAQPDTPDPSRQPSTRQRLAERVWSPRAVIAVALASVIVGGLGGAALASLGDDAGSGPGRGGFQRGGPGGPPGMNGNRPNGNGQGGRQWRGGVPPGAPGGAPATPAPATPTPPAPTTTS